jgi:tRNA dimethylallyltransferase
MNVQQPGRSGSARGGEPLIVIAGPTGSGKSAVALQLALEVGGEIVNFDSIQIYRGFDLGSAKPSLEERSIVPHHLYDIADANDPFNAADYAAAAERVCEQIVSRQRTPILVGGTGFYLRAFLSGLPRMPGADPELRARIRRIAQRRRGPERLHGLLRRVDPLAADRIAIGDRHRVERALEVWLLTGSAISTFAAPESESPSRTARKFALGLDRALLLESLERRVDAMYQAGLIRETQLLLEKVSPDARPFSSIGYREAVRFLSGELSRDLAIAETKRRTRAYAKRQMTWLRGEHDLCWIDASAGPDASRASILEILRQG